MRPTTKTPTPLLAARERLGLTQLQLAVKAGCSIQTISIAERTGHLTPTSAAKLARALECRAEELRP